MSSQRSYRNKAAAALFVLFGLLFIIIIIRFFTIQITGKVNGESLISEANKQYQRSSVIKGLRGDILDTQGNTIATNIEAYNLIAILDPRMTFKKKEPNHVVNYRKTARELSKYIDLSEDQVYKILYEKGKSGKFQTEFGNSGKGLTSTVKKQIENLKLPGIIFEPTIKRYYPNTKFTSNLIGYTQLEKTKEKTEKFVGKMGLEKEFDNILNGKNGSILYKSDNWNQILPNENKKIQNPKFGNDIYLTIDEKIQFFIEEALEKVEKEYQPKNITVIVADPKTGKILGMSQRPTFNLMSKEGIDKSWQNAAIEISYEPGSVMKIFTLAAAVQEGVFNPNEGYKSGKFFVKGVSQPIKDHNNGVGWDIISYLEGLQRSSNVAFANLLDKIGQDTFRNYLDKFQFGKSTDIELPNEASGKILYNWPIERYTTTFGQGTTVTAIQMVQAATAIANDGQMMQPYVVDKIIDKNTGETFTTKPVVKGHPINEETAKQVREYLRTVVNGKKGTGTMYDIPGFNVVGKTGTAQIAGTDGKYLTGHDNYIFSFLGMAPQNDPKLIVYVTVQQPNLKDNETGSEPVEKIFNPVMKNSLQYLNINTKEVKKIQKYKVPDLHSKLVKDAEVKLNEKELKSIILGNGTTIIDQTPKKGEVLLRGEKVFLKTNGESIIPNMVGWSKSDVLKVTNLLDLKTKIKGSGYLSKQSIPPNSLVKKEEIIKLEFK